MVRTEGHITRKTLVHVVKRQQKVTTINCKVTNQNYKNHKYVLTLLRVIYRAAKTIQKPWGQRDRSRGAKEHEDPVRPMSRKIEFLGINQRKLLLALLFKAPTP